MPLDVARMWHEIAVPCDHLYMSEQDPNDHFVTSWAESFIKVIWWAFFAFTWAGAILSGSIVFILCMIPVSVFFYKVVFKADAISTSVWQGWTKKPWK
jgi:hypothetical protein